MQAKHTNKCATLIPTNQSKGVHTTCLPLPEPLLKQHGASTSPTLWWLAGTLPLPLFCSSSLVVCVPHTTADSLQAGGTKSCVWVPNTLVQPADLYTATIQHTAVGCNATQTLENDPVDTMQADAAVGHKQSRRSQKCRQAAALHTQTRHMDLEHINGRLICNSRAAGCQPEWFADSQTVGSVADTVVMY